MNRHPEVLVTGAAGYLGRHLVENLCTDHDVIAQVREAKCAPVHGANRHVAFNLSNPDADWANALNGVKQVICLAGMDAEQCASDPSHAVKVNIESVVRLTAYAKDAGVDRLLYVSTIHVYGMPLPAHIDESTPTDPRHPYACSKLAAEHFLRSSSIPTTVLRLSNAFGAPLEHSESAWKLAANDMCRQAAKTKAIHVRSPLQHRNMISVRAAVAAIRHLMRLPATKSWDVYNVGGLRCFSMRELAGLIAVRCEETLGFLPKVAEALNSTSSPSTDFNIDKLIASGFHFADTIESEIDRCLRACADNP